MNSMGRGRKKTGRAVVNPNIAGFYLRPEDRLELERLQMWLRCSRSEVVRRALVALRTELGTLKPKNQ